MNERDLAAVDDIYNSIKYHTNSLDIAKINAPGLLIWYQTEGFQADDGKKYNKLETHGVLGVEREELRLCVTEAINTFLESKIQTARLALQKLGVKLEEAPREQETEMKKRLGKKVKTLKGPKQLRLVAPPKQTEAT